MPSSLPALTIPLFPPVELRNASTWDKLPQGWVRERMDEGKEELWGQKGVKRHAKLHAWTSCWPWHWKKGITLVFCTNHMDNSYLGEEREHEASGRTDESSDHVNSEQKQNMRGPRLTRRTNPWMPGKFSLSLLSSTTTSRPRKCSISTDFSRPFPV